MYRYSLNNTEKYTLEKAIREIKNLEDSIDIIIYKFEDFLNDYCSSVYSDGYDEGYSDGYSDGVGDR